MDKEQFSFSFIVHGSKVGEIERKLVQDGCTVYHVVPKKKNFLKNRKQIKDIINHNSWDVIHCHQGFSNVVPLMLAKKKNIKIRISHAHGVSNKISKFYKVFRYLSNKNSTINLACSKFAGQKVFGKYKFSVLKNAIDPKTFMFDENVRNEYREKYEIKSNEIVILQVGRLSIEKNHMFSLNLFSRLPDNYKFIIIGNGPEGQKISEYIAQNESLKNRVILIDNTPNVSGFMSMSDIMLFPSINEGLGIVAIEAQATGLFVMASNNVTEETKISQNICYLPLDEQSWLEKIKSLDYDRFDRKAFNKCLYDEKYDILSNVNIYESILCGGDLNE